MERFDPMDKDFADFLLNMFGGMPLKFIVEFPNGDRADLGGMSIVSRERIMEQIGAGLIGIGMDLVERSEEHETKRPHHTTNPSSN